MEKRLLVLNLFLNELGLSSNISSVSKRKIIQKSIYLVQQSVVDLGYGFGWYLMGPYSTELADDYYELQEVKLDNTLAALKPEVKTKLHAISKIMDCPKNIHLQKDDWLELLASVHFLHKVRKYDWEKTVEKMKLLKPQLVTYIDNSKESLNNAGLI